MSGNHSGNRRPSTTNLLFGILTIAYPFLVYFGLNRVPVRVLAGGIFVLALLRLVLLAPGRVKINGQAMFPAVMLAGIGLVVYLRQDAGWLLYYPVAVNATMLVLFGLSYLSPPTIIERFAALKEPELNAVAIAYCRKVTLVWCVFFVINGSLATMTAWWANMDVWTLYNGLISYLLMGLLFGVEWIVRQRVRRASTG